MKKVSTATDIISKALRSKQDEPRERSGKFSPSGFGRCYRYQYLNRQNVTATPIDDRTLRVFQAGHLFHKFVQDLYPEAEKEVECKTEDVLGYADLVTEDTVIDIKSQHSKSFWYMEKKGSDIAKDKYPNWLQVAFYGVHLKKKYISLLFISKDDCCTAQYVDETDNWITKLNCELVVLNRYWVAEEMPDPKPRAYGGKECTYCQFSKLCKEMESKTEQEKELDDECRRSIEQDTSGESKSHRTGGSSSPRLGNSEGNPKANGSSQDTFSFSK